VTILHSTARVRPAHHRIPTVNVPSRAVKGQCDRDSLERRGVWARNAGAHYCVGRGWAGAAVAVSRLAVGRRNAA
jgi:hypothetical protein